MSVIRINKTKDYSVISNLHLKDGNLSLKAKGLLSVMLSLPDDWDYSVEGLNRICKENETAIKSALNELREFGYLEVIKKLPNQTPSGRFEYEYIVYEKPKQEVEKQGIENLPVEILPIENHGQLNTNILNTKEQNTKNNDKDIIESFEKFWQSYPKKVNKQGCLKTFKANKLHKEIDKILYAIDLFKKTKQWQDTQYIPYPSTFLHQRRWDECENGKVGDEIVSCEEWAKEYWKDEKPVVKYTDKELEEWHYREFGERVKYKNGVIEKPF